MGLSSPPFPQQGPKGRSLMPHLSPQAPPPLSLSWKEHRPLLSPPPPPEFSWLGSLPASPSCGPLQPPTFVSQAGMGFEDPTCAGVFSPGGSPLATSCAPTGPQRLGTGLDLCSSQGCLTLTEPQPKAEYRRPSLSSRQSSSRQSSSLRTPFSSLPHCFSLIVPALDHKLCEARRPSGTPAPRCSVCVCQLHGQL